MSPEQAAAIVSFFSAVERLQSLEVIRSSRYLGDIGEFLCHATDGTVLVPQLRNPGFDGMSGDARVQIKFNNSPTGNNIDVGDPSGYDILVIIVGPQSKLRELDHRKDEYRHYRFLNSEVESWKSLSGRFYCARARLAKCSTKQSLAVGVANSGGIAVAA